MSDDHTHDPVPVQTAFFVVVDINGIVSVHTSDIPSVNLQREATLNDIETFGSQLVRTVTRLLDAHAVSVSLTPTPDPTASERVSEALTKRKGE